MRVSGHSLTPPHHEKSVFGHKRRKSRPSAMLPRHLLCEAVACATVEALLGSEARSWHAALWNGTDDYTADCGLRSRQPLCPKPPTRHLPVKPHQGVSVSRFQNFFQREGKSIFHQCGAPPPIQLLPLRHASAFLEGTRHSLETSRKGKMGLQFRERQRCQLSLRKPISTNDSISWLDL